MSLKVSLYNRNRNDERLLTLLQTFEQEDICRDSLEYLSMNMQFSVENVEELTPIQKFYNDQNTLITGGTGFMGKLFIERLLRICLDIICIYFLIRPKKGKTPLERAEELFRDSMSCSLVTCNSM
ncbi:fatty acyl-CoA reductase wat-like isoform X2 [Vespula squamosa]|uniref:Fatty acyl-CoA reductase n=1 Tax=Vespula squamosa TaxID=30214 RepID=A0ABD2AF73_VESSQ